MRFRSAPFHTLAVLRLSLALLTAPAVAQTIPVSDAVLLAEPTLGVQGSGWREIVLVPGSTPAFASRMAVQPALVQSSRRVGQSINSSPARLVLTQIDSAAALPNAPLPVDIKNSLIAVFPANRSVFVDTELASAISANDPAARIRVPLPNPLDPLGPPLEICDSSKAHSYTASKRVPLSKTIQLAGSKALGVAISGSWNGELVVTHTISFMVTSGCIPYAAWPSDTKITLNLDLDNTPLTLSGAATASESYSDEQSLWSGYFCFSIGSFPVCVDWRTAVRYGYDALVRLGGSVGLNSTLRGRASFTLTCPPLEPRCKLSSTDTSALSHGLGQPSLGTALQLDAVFDPFVVPFVQAGLYWMKLDSVLGGLKLSIPIKYFGYSGNTCSDGDGDGTFETVKTQFVDVMARVSGMSGYVLPWVEVLDPTTCCGAVGRAIGGALADVLAREKTHEPIVAKSLYYSEASGPIGVFDPVVRFINETRTWREPSGALLSGYTRRMKLSMRSCAPIKQDFIANFSYDSRVISPRIPKGSEALVDLESQSVVGQALFIPRRADPVLISVQDDWSRSFKPRSSTAQEGSLPVTPPRGGGMCGPDPCP